ncbi:hypothetical protein ACKI1Q_32645 [Streptomyces galilaeus]|uniref:hypothetical protein n=1 Tax=Streptomyces galilaeus TaxID=33899 RepID=UPI0038F6ED17
MSGDKDIKASGLDSIAQGITLTLSELKEIGVDSMAGAGRASPSSPSRACKWGTKP